MIELEKMCIFSVKNSCKLDTYQIIKIFTVLCSAYIVTKDEDWFNQLYDLNWLKKDVRNADVVARKF